MVSLGDLKHILNATTLYQDTKVTDATYAADFEYSHKNPYHDRLEEFSDFVLRDSEGEECRGKWNEQIFKRDAPLCVEIGSGYGHFMLEYCEKNQDQNFVGMDYRFKRSFSLAKKLAQMPVHNFRYLRARGERLEYLFGENEVDTIFYFFPDPWPKTKHHKKRLFQEPFLKAAKKVLKPGGKLYIKTDHDHYGEWMKRVIDQNHEDLNFKILLQTTDIWREHPDHFLCSFKTKFEKIFLEQNINIKAFVLEAN